MGDYHLHWTGPGGCLTQGGHTDFWRATKDTGGWELGILAAGDGDAGGRIRGYGKVFSEEAEYGFAIHCETANSVHMQGDGTDAKDVVR